MNMGWIYRRVHSRTTPCDSRWNRGGRWRGTVSVLTKTFSCWARQQKPRQQRATAATIWSPWFPTAPQSQHSAGTQQIHAAWPQREGQTGTGQQLPLQEPPARPRAALTLCPVVLNYHQAWNTFLLGQARGQALMKKKKLQQNTYRDVPLGKTWAAPFLPLSFHQLLPLGLLSLNTNHTGKKEAQGKPLEHEVTPNSQITPNYPNCGYVLL